MNKILVDSNVVLDVLLDRKPHSLASSAVWAAVETKSVEGVLPAHAFTAIHYLIRKELGSSKALRMIASILQVFGVAPVDHEVIRHALQLNSPDFEDAVSAASAGRAGCDAIVTRDRKGFPDSPIRVLTPESAAHLFSQR